MLVDDPYVEDGVDLCTMWSKNSLMQEFLKSLSEQNVKNVKIETWSYAVVAEGK